MNAKSVSMPASPERLMSEEVSAATDSLHGVPSNANARINSMGFPVFPQCCPYSRQAVAHTPQVTAIID
jgi:hypothetical protein